MNKKVASKSLTPLQKTCLAGIMGATMMGLVGAAIAVTGWTVFSSVATNPHP